MSVCAFIEPSSLWARCFCAGRPRRPRQRRGRRQSRRPVLRHRLGRYPDHHRVGRRRRHVLRVHVRGPPGHHDRPGADGPPRHLDHVHPQRVVLHREQAGPPADGPRVRAAGNGKPPVQHALVRHRFPDHDREHRRDGAGPAAGGVGPDGAVRNRHEHGVPGPRRPVLRGDVRGGPVRNGRRGARGQGGRGGPPDLPHLAGHPGHRRVVRGGQGRRHARLAIDPDRTVQQVQGRRRRPVPLLDRVNDQHGPDGDGHPVRRGRLQTDGRSGRQRRVRRRLQPRDGGRHHRPDDRLQRPAGRPDGRGHRRLLAPAPGGQRHRRQRHRIALAERGGAADPGGGRDHHGHRRRPHVPPAGRPRHAAGRRSAHRADRPTPGGGPGGGNSRRARNPAPSARRRPAGRRRRQSGR